VVRNTSGVVGHRLSPDPPRWVLIVRAARGRSVYPLLVPGALVAKGRSTVPGPRAHADPRTVARRHRRSFPAPSGPCPRGSFGRFVLFPAAIAGVLTLCPAPGLGDPGPEGDGEPRHTPIRARARWLLGPMNACASARDLSRDIETVLGRTVFALGDQPAIVRVDVQVRDVEGPGDGWRIDVRTHSDGEPDGTRHLELDPMPCREARRSLVEVLALGLDYRVPEPPPPPSPSPAPSSPEPSGLAVSPGLAALGTVGWGLLPGTGFGLGGAVDLLATGSTLRGWSLELGALGWLEGRTAATEAGNQARASFRAWQAQIGVCRRFSIVKHLAVDGCLGGVFGQLRGSVRAAPDGPSVDYGRRWLGGPRLALGVMLSELGPVELGLRGTLLINVARDDYATGCVAPGDGCPTRFTVHAQDTVVPGLELALRWRIDS